MMPDINYWAVIVAAVANMVLGFLWFGPLFGKAWASAAGMTPEKMAEAMKKGSTVSYLLMFLGSLLMAYVLDNAIIFGNAYLHTSGICAAMMGAFWYWLGIVLPVTIGVVLWDGKPWKYWAITYVYNLVAMLAMGAILGAWM